MHLPTPRLVVRSQGERIGCDKEKETEGQSVREESKW